MKFLRFCQLQKKIIGKFKTFHGIKQITTMLKFKQKLCIGTKFQEYNYTIFPDQFLFNFWTIMAILIIIWYNIIIWYYKYVWSFTKKKNQAVYRGITVLYNHIALSSMDLNLIKLITIHACTGHVRDFHYNMTQVICP